MTASLPNVLGARSPLTVPRESGYLDGYVKSRTVNVDTVRTQHSCPDFDAFRGRRMGIVPLDPHAPLHPCPGDVAVPRTPRSTPMKHPHRRRAVAGVAALALVAGAVQLLPSAGADEVVIRQVCEIAEDSGSSTSDRDGVAEYAGYGVTNSALSVGEQPPRRQRPAPAAALHRLGRHARRGPSGGDANVSIRVWRADNLTTQKVVLDTYTGATGITTTDSPAGDPAGHARTGRGSPGRRRHQGGPRDDGTPAC